MGWNGLERNKLDYILTDLLPVEVSELFSFSQLYAFLLEKDTQKVVDSLICETKQNKAKGKFWCCTIKVDIENSKGQYIEKDKQEATKDGSESTKIQHGI